MTIAELGLKAFKLEDTWEEMVADLRAVRASFASLASVLACKKTLQDNFEFLLDSAKALLKARAMGMDASELRDARGVFRVLWPAGDPSTKEARLAHCAACTPLAALAKAEDGSAIQFPLRVERTNLFQSALEQIGQASADELRKPLQVCILGPQSNPLNDHDFFIVRQGHKLRCNSHLSKMMFSIVLLCFVLCL